MFWYVSKFLIASPQRAHARLAPAQRGRVRKEELKFKNSKTTTPGRLCLPFTERASVPSLRAFARLHWEPLAPPSLRGTASPFTFPL